MTNWEKYKSLDDRVQAFRRYCADTECPNCCIKPYTGLKHTGCVDRCILKWLALEAEEEKLGPCPFCGADGIITVVKGGGFKVFCVECLSMSSAYLTKDKAIAAWNRRAK